MTLCGPDATKQLVWCRLRQKQNYYHLYHRSYSFSEKELQKFQLLLKAWHICDFFSIIGFSWHVIQSLPDLGNEATVLCAAVLSTKHESNFKMRNTLFFFRELNEAFLIPVGTCMCYKTGCDIFPGTFGGHNSRRSILEVTWRQNWTCSLFPNQTTQHQFVLP